MQCIAPTACVGTAGRIRELRGRMHTLALILLAAALAAPPGSGEVRVLDDFEEGRIGWTGQVALSIVAEHASHGGHALKVTFPAGTPYPGIAASAVETDWSGFDVLKFDVFNPQGTPVDLNVRIDDPSSTGYYSRYNGEFLAVNGWNAFEIPLERLRAGNRALDVSRIAAFVIFLSAPERELTLFIDNIRLVSGEEPAWAAGDFSADESAPERAMELRRKAEAAAARLRALIDLAHERGFGTIEANIALVTAKLGLDVRPELQWFSHRTGELYDYVAVSCERALAKLKTRLDGDAPDCPVPPIHSTAALEAAGGHFVEKQILHKPQPRRPVLIFSMLYHREGPLCEYFTPINYFVHSHAFAGASRFDVENTPLYEAFRRYPETHRVWNDDEGWCGHIVRDKSSLGGGDEPVVVCLESPKTRQAIEEYIRMHAGRWKDRPEVLLNIMGGELSYICYCPRTLEMFREWLEERHGNIERLNDIWGTSHESFEDITVMPNARQAAENRARWYDWQEFNCHRFVRHALWVKSVIRSIDPDMAVAAGAVGYSFKPQLGRSGADEENLVRLVDDIVLNEGGESTITTDLLWSFAEGEKPLVDFEYHGDVAGILPHFLHGNSAMAMWWWPREPDRAFPQFNRTALPFSWEIPLSDVAECLKIALDVRRLSPQIAAFHSAPAEMAILYSRASMLQVDPAYLQFDDTPYTMETKKVYDAMLGLDAPLRFVSSRQVAEGKLARFKLLVVPAAGYVMEEVADEIFRFARGGGTVVVTPGSLMFDEYARPRGYLDKLGIEVEHREEPAPAASASERHEYLQEFFRRVRTGEMPMPEITLVRPGAAAVNLRGRGALQSVRAGENARVLGVAPDGAPAILEIPYGQGRFYYLACPLDAPSMNAFLDVVADAAGISRPVRFVLSEGGRDRFLEGRAVDVGEAVLLYVVNHGEAAADVRVELPFDPPEVTDLRDPARRVDLSRLRVKAGRTRILAARKRRVR